MTRAQCSEFGRLLVASLVADMRAACCSRVSWLCRHHVGGVR